MLGFLSLNLGIFNLLPIPVLDGGAIFLLLIEGLLATVGLTISMTVRERIQQVGFVMVLLLMVFVISNDVLKLFSAWLCRKARSYMAKMMSGFEFEFRVLGSEI